MEAPEPLVTTDESGMLSLNQKVVRYLDSVTQKLTVVSIVGSYRTGKSYLLNRLMGKQTGFPMGSTIRSETKGIWVWLRQHPLDRSRRLLLMDTEGLYDPDKADQKHDIAIFSLAILLSSMFIYNSKGTIDDKSIHDLHFTVEMAKHIKIKAKDGQSGEDLCRVFPLFVWAVRDFALELKVNGEKISPNQYLEDGLKLKPGHTKPINDANNIRRSIRDFFKKRYCFTFPSPVVNEKMKDLDTLPESELKPSFLEAGERFSEFVFMLAPTKQIDGKEVNGRIFVAFLRCYLEAIRKGAIPCIESAVNNVSAVENSKWIATAVKNYDDRMSSLSYPVPEKILHKHNREAQIEAFDFFSEQTIFDNDGKYRENLGEALADRFKVYIEKNDSESRELCKGTLSDLYKHIGERVKSGDFLKPGGYKEYEKQMVGLENEYRRCPNKGPMADSVFHEFLKQKEVAKQQILAADSKLTVSERQREEERSKWLEADRKKKLVEQDLERSKRQLEELKRNHESNIANLEREMNQEMQRQVNQLKQRLQSEKQERLQRLQDAHERLNNNLRHRIDDLEEEVEAERNSQQQMRSDFERRLQISTAPQQQTASAMSFSACQIQTTLLGSEGLHQQRFTAFRVSGGNSGARHFGYMLRSGDESD